MRRVTGTADRLADGRLGDVRRHRARRARRIGQPVAHVALAREAGRGEGHGMNRPPQAEDRQRGKQHGAESDGGDRYPVSQGRLSLVRHDPLQEHGDVRRMRDQENIATFFSFAPNRQCVGKRLNLQQLCGRYRNVSLASKKNQSLIRNYKTSLVNRCQGLDLDGMPAIAADSVPQTVTQRNAEALTAAHVLSSGSVSTQRRRQ